LGDAFDQPEIGVGAEDFDEKAAAVGGGAEAAGGGFRIDLGDDGADFAAGFYVERVEGAAVFIEV
jgi:hypothetical protein